MHAHGCCGTDGPGFGTGRWVEPGDRATSRKLMRHLRHTQGGVFLVILLEHQGVDDKAWSMGAVDLDFDGEDAS